MPNAGEIEAGEFATWRAGGRDHVLLDVREDEELAVDAIDGALHIPMNEVPGRIDEIPKDKPVIVMCAVGIRSWHVAQFLAARGVDRVYNLEGGIEAYRRRAKTNQ